LKTEKIVSPDRAGRYYLIVNPISGQRRHDKRIQEVQEFFAQQNIPLDVSKTQYSGHAYALAKRARDENKEYRVIIAAGGDGTVSEVANALAGSSIPLGILPWGTTNVFALEMGFPKSLKAQCRLLLKPHIAALDLGRCNGKGFLLMAGIGFDAYTLRSMPNIKQGLGPLAYAMAAFQSFSRYKAPAIRYWTKDSRPREARYLLASNTSKYGGIFSLAPRANPLDGKLDIYAFREKGKNRYFKLALNLLFSAIRPESRFRRRLLALQDSIFRSTSLHLESDVPVFIQLDGDYFGQLPAELWIDPKALKIILPSRAWRAFNKN